MSLKETLMQDMKTAMKEKDQLKKNVVTMIRAAVLQTEKDTKTELDDNGVLDIIAKQLKQRRDALIDFERGGRQDLVDLTNAEIEMILTYMPEQLTTEELTKMIKDSVEKLGITQPKEMGRLMSDLMPQVKGRADGKTINAIARELLSE